MRRALAFALAWAALLAGGATSAWARDLSIEDFRTVLEVRESGEVLVSERIRVRFTGAWNGIVRVIPYGYTTRLGVRGGRGKERDGGGEQGGSAQNRASERVHRSGAGATAR